MKAVATDVGRPFCAVCKKPVESIEIMDGFATLTRTYRVSCHGKEERVVLTHLELNIAKEIVFADAFSTPLLEARP